MARVTSFPRLLTAGSSFFTSTASYAGSSEVKSKTSVQNRRLATLGDEPLDTIEDLLATIPQTLDLGLDEPRLKALFELITIESFDRGHEST
jgi:hypothetical protein